MDETDRPGGVNPALLTALTTEHFTLQGARGATISESASRSSLFVSALSSSLVALGFVAQLSGAGEVFRAFAFVVLPVLILLGLFTWVRVLENGMEDFQYARAINRIRHFYLQIEPAEGRLFLLSGHDDAAGVMANMAIGRRRGQILYTSASMVAMLNSVLVGAVVALALDAATGAAIGVGVVLGAVAGAAALVVQLVVERRSFDGRAADLTVLFPTPGATETAGPTT